MIDPCGENDEFAIEEKIPYSKYMSWKYCAIFAYLWYMWETINN
jgi:hypothetical protein